MAELKAAQLEVIAERDDLKRQLEHFEHNNRINEKKDGNNVNGNLNVSSNKANKEELVRLRHDLAKWQEAYQYRNERYEHYKTAWAKEKERCISLLQEHNEAKNESREWELKYDQLRNEQTFEKNERVENGNDNTNGNVNGNVNGHSIDHSRSRNASNGTSENSDTRKRLRELQRQNEKVQ